MMNQFSNLLLRWYAQNKRELPWRDQQDAYKIWISEVILQQTRIEQGWQYYLRFINQFADVFALAAADQDQVLKCWQGLGYYSRARNLHEGAKYVVEQYKGVFPADYQELLKIKGVGTYTAAAIASMAFNLPCAVVDGNVYRVLSRVFGIHTAIDSSMGKKEFQTLASYLLEGHCPSEFNQALMDFGAIACKAQHPLCEDCPFIRFCVAYQENKIHLFPVKEKKTKIKNRYFYYFFIHNQSFTYINKREKGDIWAGLYQFPLIEYEKEIEELDLLEDKRFFSLFENCDFEIREIRHQAKHQLSHQSIFATFVNVNIKQGEPTFVSKTKKIALSQLDQYPISRLTELYLLKEKNERKQ